MNAREIAELLASGKFYKTDPNDHIKQEICKLAKAYLDVLNAEPVAEVISTMKTPILGTHEVLVGMQSWIEHKAELKIGDKLYLRKE